MEKSRASPVLDEKRGSQTSQDSDLTWPAGSTENLNSPPVSPVFQTRSTGEKPLPVPPVHSRSSTHRMFTISGGPGSHRKCSFRGDEQTSDSTSYGVSDHGRVYRNATRVPQHDVLYLTEEEIDSFVDDLDHNGDGYIDISEIEAKLDQVHDEIIDQPKPHHLTHDSQGDRARHAFLHSLIGSNGRRVRRDEFKDIVRGWCIPSMKQEQEEEEEMDRYVKSLPFWRRFRSWWSVHGPKVMFIAFVVAFELAFGVWQFVNISLDQGTLKPLDGGWLWPKPELGSYTPRCFSSSCQ